MSKPTRPDRRRWAVAATAIAWSGLGLALPFFATFDAPEIAIRNASVSAASSHSFTLSESVPLTTVLGIVAERGTLALLDGAAVVTSGDAAQALLAQGNGTILADGLVMRTLGTARPRDGDVHTAPIIEALMAGRFEALKIKSGTFVLNLGEGRAETLTAIDVEALNRRRNGIQVKGAADIRGFRHTFDVQIGAAGDKKPAVNVPVKASIKGVLFSGTLDGRLSNTGAFEIQGALDGIVADVNQSARAFGFAASGVALGELKIKSRLDWTRGTLAFDKATFQLGGNEGTGAMSLSVGGSRPAVSGTLAVKTLDVTGLIKALQTSAADERSSWSQRVWGEPAAPLAHQLDADVRLSATKLVVPGVELGAVAAGIDLKSGKLLVDLAEFELAGGRGSGQLQADFTRYRPQLTWRGKLDGVDGGRLSQMLVKSPVLQGTVNAAADVTTEGLSGAHIRRSVTGRVTIGTKDAARVGLDLKALATTAGRTPTYGWETLPKGSSAVDKLEVRLDVRNGIVTPQGWQVRSGDAVLAVGGRIALPDQRIDLSVSAQPAQPSIGAAAGVAGDAVSEPSILQIVGPLDSPLIRRDPPPGRAAEPGAVPGRG